MKILSTIAFFTLCCAHFCSAQGIFDTTIKPADHDTSAYISLLKNKNVALIINQTSMIGNSSLLDVLLRNNIHITKLFVPEHGFRGTADAGATVNNATDSATGTPIISLYGSHKKPTPAELKNVDVMVYDLQDVGVRFYTYISTLQYCMEACGAHGVRFMILDRPDPNGFYVDGPVLEPQQSSFVGLQKIPIVYGMTPGEYANMLCGEKLIDSVPELMVIKCKNYDHTKKYNLPTWPSPNLRSMAAIYAYPSLCLFEGTKISVGRGTERPFLQFGSPALQSKMPYCFTPLSGSGAKSPFYEGQKCYGESLSDDASAILQLTNGRIYLKWLIDAYHFYPDAKDSFFSKFFVKLSGTPQLEQQIKNGLSEAAIRSSWQPGIEAFKAIRKKYLLYNDFE